MEFSLSRTTDETYDTTFTVKVGVDLLLEGGLVHVTGADSDTDSDSLFLGLAGDVLPDGDGGVDTTTLLEESADSSARALGGNEDDINISGRNDLGVLLVDNGETVREVEGLALGDERGNLGPGL